MRGGSTKHISTHADKVIGTRKNIRRALEKKNTQSTKAMGRVD